MAMADYYLCDGCGGKCFYDANLNWDTPEPGETPVRGSGMVLDRCGDMAALCVDCAKTHEVKVVPIESLEAKDGD